MLKTNHIFLLFFLIVTSCSVKRNSFKNRTFNKLNTDYNILFNANEAIKSALLSSEGQFVDDFTIPIRVEKEPKILKNDTLKIVENTGFKKDALRAITSYMVLNEDEKEKTLTGFDKAIYKANKAIAYHSMLINGTEYNSSIYKAEKMIGMVRYYRGQSIQALEAFEYAKDIAKKLNQKKGIDLWIAKSYAQLGNYSKAEQIYKNLVSTSNKEILKKALKEQTQIKIDQGKYIEALDLLKRDIALEKNKSKKARLIFLMAQVKDHLNLKKEAQSDYIKVRELKPENQIKLKSYTHYISSKDTILLLEVVKLKKELNKYLKNSYFTDFKDEIYLALAVLNEKRNDTINSKIYYEKALKAFSSDPDNKMIIYKNIAENFFKEDNYRLSKKYYDSVILNARQEKATLFKDRLKKLNQLDSLYAPYLEKDSIVSLTKMNEIERRVYFEKHIKKLKDREADKLENKKNQQQSKENLEQRKLYAITNDQKKAWYFYNPKLLLQGEKDFVQKWGSRSSDGFWRRISAQNNSKNNNNSITIDSTTINNKNPLIEAKYDIDEYIKNLPKEDEVLELIQSRDLIQLKLGVAYYSLFKNSKKAFYYLKNLLERPQDSLTEQKIYFNLYKIYKDLNQPKEYTLYKNLILDKFPDSIYAAYVKNPVEFLSSNSNEAALILYKNAYDLYKEKNYIKSLSVIESNIDNYNKEAIAPKFALLKAHIIGQLKGKDAMFFELNKLQLLYENTDEAKRAKEMITELNK